MDLNTRLWKDLHTSLMANGASVVGSGSMLQVPGWTTDGYPTGISIGVALDPVLLGNLVDRGPSHAFRENTALVRATLVSLRQSCVDFLIERGHQALFSRSGITNEASYTSDLPHKTVATRAGLGWIGKSALLISEEFGAALRLTSVLTDAPLPVARSCDVSRCVSCEACVVHCPGKAILGGDWRVGVDRAVILSPEACEKPRTERSRLVGLGDARLCDVCIAVCPWTTRFVQERTSQQAHTADAAKPAADGGWRDGNDDDRRHP
jgi:epoxyqueuosine reductase